MTTHVDLTTDGEYLYSSASHCMHTVIVIHEYETKLTVPFVSLPPSHSLSPSHSLCPSPLPSLPLLHLSPSLRLSLHLSLSLPPSPSLSLPPSLSLSPSLPPSLALSVIRAYEDSLRLSKKRELELMENLNAAQRDSQEKDQKCSN